MRVARSHTIGATALVLREETTFFFAAFFLTAFFVDEDFFFAGLPDRDTVNRSIVVQQEECANRERVISVEPYAPSMVFAVVLYSQILHAELESELLWKVHLSLTKKNGGRGEGANLAHRDLRPSRTYYD